MQDNARTHVAGVCQQFLQDEVIEAMDWPARSIDLNPIEHSWEIMSRTIHQRHVAPLTVQELEDALVQVWEEIPQETIRHPGIHTRLRPHTLPYKAPSPQITTRGSVPTHYHMRLHPHTLPHEAPSPPTLPHKVPSPHIITRGSVLTHYHTWLRPHTLPHEAPSSHITTRGSLPTHYPHKVPSPHIITRGSVLTHYHTWLRPHTLPHEAPSSHITTRGSLPTHYHTLIYHLRKRY
ncbi:unnamed protein product [Ranitomeya imitator]|uniref:Tc1-like transposase DDE domain-containing protein n=1 Tax=Ranitomeya imitator TaxID=111125 RepID=A0ABN9LQU0_9NEOB|nr:unnamed protein product [Ranitomeya imitator]